MMLRREAAVASMRLSAAAATPAADVLQIVAGVREELAGELRARCGSSTAGRRTSWWATASPPPCP
ncbi:hypothetical protein E1292_46765 [Nonomuraea deserti]|uniref:Uncharacterized protein n=1 Tax=Nonomuraea deserti TaxID=1848322 RepID=A0A4R4U7Z1_9ACTN|nr:hypothetical protein [Nonomuraea deserti]TDC87401.1 hypothetical protein E1292_46765 [Nonomuraea deserti]